MWSGGALQLWGPLFTDMHIEIHKHAPWGAPWWICDGGERLGTWRKGVKEKVCQRKKGKRDFCKLLIFHHQMPQTSFPGYFLNTNW